MAKDRIARLNSLLKEVISEVIQRDVSNPHVHRLISVTSVDVSKDLQHAKVFISVIGTAVEKKATITALQSAAGYISILASKKVIMRYFPALIFKLDDSVDKQFAIEAKLEAIQEEQQLRLKNDE